MFFLESESPTLNAIAKVRRNSCDQVFLGMTLSKEIYHDSGGSGSHQLVLSYRYFSTNNKNENMEYYGSFISFKSHSNSKQGSHIFLLFGSRSGVFISISGLSQSFSYNSNLIILVYIQRLLESNKLMLCISKGVYILFKKMISCCSTLFY